MTNYRKSAYATYDIKYHIIWITKYRKPVITGKIAERNTGGICRERSYTHAGICATPFVRK